MTPETQRIAIAEHCGWRVHPKDKWVVIPPNSPHSVQPLHTLPDYLNDLNAMHAAEEKLINEDYGPLYGECLDWNWHATAAQRAEAFLRTIGKWFNNETIICAQ